MLQESNKILNSLKDQNKIRAIKKARRKYFYTMYKKYLIKLSLITLILWVSLFPVHAGTVFGTWIQQFLMTVYNIGFQSIR